MFLLVTVAAFSQPEVDFLNAIGKGDLKSLDTHMASKVNLCINDNTEEIKKSVAVQKIEAFLKSKKIIKFKMLHNGNSSDKNSSYRVARIKTQSGTYRIFAYSENSGGAKKVVEVRIDAM